jgi:hypothetical protein
MRNAYPTISIAVPTTTVLKYQVRWRSSRNRWAASPSPKRTTPKTPTASDGVYLELQCQLFGWVRTFRLFELFVPIYDDGCARFCHRIWEVRVDVALDGSTGGVCHCRVVTGRPGLASMSKERWMFGMNNREARNCKYRLRPATFYMKAQSVSYMDISNVDSISCC